MVLSFKEDFSVTWQRPADADRNWLLDIMHFPKAMTPLTQELVERIHREYMSADTVFVNGYGFVSGLNPPPPTEEILKRGVFDVWTNDYLPLIVEECRRLRLTDYDAMSATQLGEMFPQILDRGVTAFGYTMKAITGFMGPTFGLVSFLSEEIGEDGPRSAATLLQGFENGTAAAGAGLTDLAELASTLPAVAEALRRGNYDDVGSLEGGPDFLEALQKYLEQFGWRVDTWGTLHLPTWAENPRMPLMLIGRYLNNPDRTPSAQLRRSVAQREAAISEIESRIRPEKLDQFRAMLAASQSHVPMSEGRALWQLIIIGSVRAPALAAGRKLVSAGALNSPEEVFYLTGAEIEEALTKQGTDFRATVAKRLEEFLRFQRMAPPPFIGAAPDMSQVPPEMIPLLHLFFGVGAPVIEGNLIKGQAASSGIVRGRARVIHDLGEAERLQPGEILVCTTTAPPWTPLFAIAAGVITDSGGVLSHSAICAREYAIPCVVATQVATHVIPDGAILLLDGDAGTVTIEG